MKNFKFAVKLGVMCLALIAVYPVQALRINLLALIGQLEKYVEKIPGIGQIIYHLLKSLKPLNAIVVPLLNFLSFLLNKVLALLGL